MSAFVTGGAGFIGKRLVRRLLERDEEPVYVLVYPPQLTPEFVAGLKEFWGGGAERVTLIGGDISKPDFGISASEAGKLEGRIDHFFHLAAIYDLKAPPEQVMNANIAGVANALTFAKSIKAGRFHHVSSIAAAGLYDGVFREDMFEEARGLEHPYYGSKHKGEGLVRAETEIPWRVYRPAICVGDSRTGEIDKIDGPYYFFKLIQKLRDALPSWVPMIGIEGGRINVVPVDFIVAAIDHLAHLDGLDGRAFHLTDPNPMRVGDLLSVLTKAAHGPAFTVKVNASLFGLAPRALTRGLMALTPFRRMQTMMMKELGLPEDVFMFVNYPTRFDSRETHKLLSPAGITVPAFEDYAWRLWDYWERHLDPDLFVDRSLRGAVAGKRVLVTGGSGGIGKAIALRLAGAGAKTLIVARDPDKLNRMREEFSAQGLEVESYSADISDPALCAAFIQRIIGEHGGVDILINNAGRSIRRAVENSYDRLHDFERLMRLNYLAAVQLTMGFLPGMAERRSGHVVNISSIAAITTQPRFSAYVASKAALEGWSDSAASEFLDRGVAFTNVNMPLVRTEMTAPTKFYEHVPLLGPEEAAGLVVEAIIHRPARVATPLGRFGQAVRAVAPNFGRIILNTTFRMFPESAAATGGKEGEVALSADQIAFAQLLRGLHL